MKIEFEVSISEVSHFQAVIRQTLKLTQLELADKLGLTSGGVSLQENDKRPITTKQLIKLEEISGGKIYLVFRKDDENELHTINQ